MALDRTFDLFKQSILNMNQLSTSTSGWLEPFINYGACSGSPYNLHSGSGIKNLVRSFIGEDFGPGDWYQHNYSALVKLFQCKIDLRYTVSETLQELLPVFESHVCDVQDIVASAVWVLAQDRRDQELEKAIKAIKAITLEMERQPEWNVLRKFVARLLFADIFASCDRHDSAAQTFQHFLGADFPVIATIAQTVNIGFTSARMLDGSYPSDTTRLEQGSVNQLELTEECVETMKEYVGKDRMVGDITYVFSILILQRSKRCQVTVLM